jgi:predicted N-formylglutamate amidohydrolase
MQKPPFILLSCLHATNKIPEKYKSLYKSNLVVSGQWGQDRVGNIIKDHWGSDIGALKVARFLSSKTSLPLVYFPLSRLFIEPENIDDLPYSLYTEPFASDITDSEKKKWYKTHWLPYIKEIESRIEQANKKGMPLIHIVIHTFTPVKNGKPQNGDIGILFDPKRSLEKVLANEINKELKKKLPKYEIMNNRPYRGDSEGLTQYFREKYPQYLGIEIEISNKHTRMSCTSGKEINKAILETIRSMS